MSDANGTIVRRRAAATIPAGLTFEGVSLRFGETAALTDIDLAIQPGEVVALLGHSGCGKTTLLRVAAGLERPDLGRVLIDDWVACDDRSFLPPEKRGVGLVFQDYALFPHLSNESNVMFGLTALSRKAASDEARSALARVGLERHAGRAPAELSGGEQQRVALARAIAPRPGILLMDEPFSGLDARLRDIVRDETLAVLRETRATAIVVTHDPEEAMRIADRIVLMRGGRILQEGRAQELYDTPSSLFAARFFSALNEIGGFVRSGRAQTPLGSFPADHLTEGTEIVAAIRPRGVEAQIVLNGDDGDGAPRGRVVACRFLGETDHVELAVEGFDRYLTSRMRGRSGLKPGDEVLVRFNASDVLVFPRED